MKTFVSKLSILSFVLILVFAPTITLKAHETWLMPKQFRVSPQGLIIFDVTSGMKFPELRYMIERDRIFQAFTLISGKLLVINNYQPFPGKSLQLAVVAPLPGVATTCLQLKPKTLTLKPKVVLEYLEEIGASDSLKNIWQKPSKALKWRETYTKHTKTFVGVGDNTVLLQDSSWSRAITTGLEIVPEKHPLFLKPGELLPVKVLMNGVPVPGFTVNTVHEQSKLRSQQITDANGHATISLPKAGRWLLAGTYLRFVGKPELDYESDFTTLTLSVQP